MVVNSICGRKLVTLSNESTRLAEFIYINDMVFVASPRVARSLSRRMVFVASHGFYRVVIVIMNVARKPIGPGTGSVR